MRRAVLLLLIVVMPTLLVAQVKHVPNRPVVLRNVTLIDMTDDRPKPNMTVVISGDRITEIGSKAAIPRNAQIVDASGKFLIPGLWDMHVHPLPSTRWDGHREFRSPMV